MAMTRSEIAKRAWEKRRATFVPPMKGKKMTAESRAKMSAAAKARPSNRLGKVHTPETRSLISAVVRERALRGPAAPGYIDGLGVQRQGERLSDRAKRWRFDVMSRDGYHCVHCGDGQGGNLQAHHRKPWALFPHLRFEPTNGITLCKPCHWLAHAYEGCVPGLN